MDIKGDFSIPARSIIGILIGIALNQIILCHIDILTILGLLILECGLSNLILFPLATVCRFHCTFPLPP